MAILYVDRLFQALPKGSQAKRHGKLWCHLWPAESTPEGLRELHRVAQVIGLKHLYFQDRNGFPHYDLTPAKRVLAIKQGAIEKDLTEWITEKGGLRALCKPKGDET